MKKLVYLVLILAFISACEKELPTTLSVSQTSITFGIEGGKEAIKISANKPWTATSTAQWCKVLPSSGIEGDVALTVEAGPNADYEERTCAITINCEELSKTIQINQYAPGTLLVKDTLFRFSHLTQMFEVAVVGNLDYTVSIDSDWISQQGTKAYKTDKLQFSVASNNNDEDRKGNILISSSDGKFTFNVSVYQGFEVKLDVSDSVFDLSEGEQTISTKVKSNVEYKVVIPDNAKNWITAAKTKSMKEDELLFKISANNTGGIRNAIIRIQQINGEAKCDISITQGTDEATMATDQYGNAYFKYHGMNFGIMSLDDNIVNLFSCDKDCATVLSIPRYITYKGARFTVSDIGYKAFVGFSELQSLTVPNTINKISRAAFEGCVNFKELIIEDGEEPIEMEALYREYYNGKPTFFDCPLEYVYLGRSIKYEYNDGPEYVGYSPFFKNKYIKTFIFSNNVTRITRLFLSKCSSLEKVVLPDNLISIAEFAFSETGIKEIKLPSSLKEIESYAFYRTALAKITFPSTIKQLNSSTFGECGALEEIHIYGLEKIESAAFLGCQNIKKIYCYVKNPPSFGTDPTGGCLAFENKVFLDATLFVPKESLDLYKSADEWKKFMTVKTLDN